MTSPAITVSDVFTKASAENRAALIGYLPAGFPSTPKGIEAMTAMVEAGVDAIEVGLPYSDPMIDGPVIQDAVDLALKGGATTRDVLTTVEAVAKTGAAALVMSYWNPIDRYGVERFAREFANAGGAGVITPDLTPDAGDEWIPVARAHKVDTIFLVAPSSTDERVELTVDACRGFVYAASTMGVTGARDRVGEAAGELVRRTKAATDTPVAVGLGVSTGAQAAEVASFADGVVVGSAFVRPLLDNNWDTGLSQVRELAQELTAGVRRGN